MEVWGYFARTSNENIKKNLLSLLSLPSSLNIKNDNVNNNVNNNYNNVNNNLNNNNVNNNVNNNLNNNNINNKNNNNNDNKITFGTRDFRQQLETSMKNQKEKEERAFAISFGYNNNNNNNNNWNEEWALDDHFIEKLANIPDQFVDPITLSLMRNPVRTPSNVPLDLSTCSFLKFIITILLLFIIIIIMMIIYYYYLFILLI